MTDRKVTIDATSLDPEMVVRQLGLAYTTGADRIIVTGLDDAPTQLQRRIERRVSQLIGTTVQETDGDRLTIANLLDSSEVSLPQTVAQAQQLTLELHMDAIDALVTDDHDLARRVIARDDDVDRLFAFVSRGFHRGLEDVTELAAEPMAGVRETVTRIDQELYERTESGSYLYGTVVQRIRRTAEHAINIADTRLGASIDHRSSNRHAQS